MNNNPASTDKKILVNEEELKVQKMKFCILTAFKSQFSRSNLLMFALDKQL